MFGARPPVVQPDLEVGNLPTDSTSALAWSPTADFLAVASWSNEIRLYEINAQGQAQPKAEYKHEGPALCVRWSKDGTKVVSGGADKAARLFDVNTGQATQVGVHDEPVKSVRWVDAAGQNLLLTGGWDKVTCFPDASGYAVGTIEGRVAIQYVDEAAGATGNFTFKCHRKDVPGTKTQAVYSVNDISFHPYGTFATAGSDGTVTFWDKDSRSRLKAFDNKGGPVVSAGFNHTGRIFAMAVANDWTQGIAGNTPSQINKVFLHSCTDEEVQKRPKK